MYVFVYVYESLYKLIISIISWPLQTKISDYAPELDTSCFSSWLALNLSPKLKKENHHPFLRAKTQIWTCRSPSFELVWENPRGDLLFVSSPLNVHTLCNLPLI